MKKMMKTWVLVAAVAMGMTACQNDIDEQVEVKDSVTIEFIADSAESRTSVDTSGEKPIFAWGENETFVVLEQTDALATATEVTYTKEDGKAKITATFDTNSGQAEYNYVTVYPASGYVSAESIEAATLALPAEQTMAEGSYDPNADLMVSEVVATDAQPTEAQMVGFTRLATVAKMTLKNFGLELGDKVEKVIFTAEGKALAGKATADLSNPHETLVAGESVSSVTVSTTSASDVYFTTLPFTLEAGDAYTITILTDKYLYVKKGTIPAEKSLAFEAGKVTRLGVDMNGIAPSEKWVLVKDASTLQEGDIVAIAAVNYNYVMGKQTTSNPPASQTEAIKFGDYLYHPISTEAAHMIQPLTLMKRDNERNAFDFYNGVDVEGDTNVGFLWATGSNGSPKLQAYCDKNTLFDVSIADGVATITANEISGSYKYLRYYHANYASSRKFDCTSTAITNDNNKICLYRLDGVEGTIPVVDANVTAPDLDEYVTIAEEGTATATAIEEVVFNYVGDWNIAVSEEADWLTVNYADGKVTYTAEANTGEKREATVTITASLEGQDDLTWTFNILQKGAPQEITIAEFITKGKDVDTTYKLTGKIVTLATNASSSGYFLADENGNEAKITYLKTENGENVWGHDNLTLQLGDVVTVTTVVAGSTKGTGGGSSYPSIYKGHYNLSATVEPELVGYEGGDAIISIAVNKYGNLGNYCTPTTIEGTMEASDFADFAYTSGDATATVTFEENSVGSRSVDVTFTSGLAEITVAVAQKNHPDVQVGWFLVTDVNELKEGDKVIIAAKSPDETLNYAFIKQTSSSSASTKGTAINLQGNSISDVEGVEQFTLGSGHADCADTWSFMGNTYSKYLYNSSGSLKFTSTLSNTGSWAITIASDGKATLEAQITNSKKIIMLTYTASNQTFSGQASGTTGKGAIYIYKYYN